MQINSKAAFIGIEEIDIHFTNKTECDIYLTSEEIQYQSFERIYIPSGMNMYDMILYLIYDYNLTKDYNNEYPSKVVYTDCFY